MEHATSLRGILLITAFFLVINVLCFSLPPDFSCWQFQPTSPTPFHYMTQCHGDADGLKIGLSYVNTSDLSLLQSLYNTGVYDARVDFDRNFVINNDDFDILGEYLNDPQIPTDCYPKLQLHPIQGPLMAGTEYTIEWDWNIYTSYIPISSDEDNPSGPFALSYSTEGGTEWIVIDTVAYTTSYNWIVPDVNIFNCTLHIEDLSHPGLEDSAGTFTILPWTGPVIAKDVDGLYFETEGDEPSDQVLLIWNDGGDVLDWTISEGCDWLEVTPLAGASAGEPNEVVIHVDMAALPGNGEFESSLTVSDTNAINSPQEVSIHLTVDMDCVKLSAPFYDDWVALGKPDCWCYRKQCRGDVNGISTFGKPVLIDDLQAFKMSYNLSEAQLLGNPLYICADLDHRAIFGRRVLTADLAILKTYFNLDDDLVPTCDLDQDGIPGADDYYNFWMN